MRWYFQTAFARVEGKEVERVRERRRPHVDGEQPDAELGEHGGAQVKVLEHAVALDLGRVAASTEERLHVVRRYGRGRLPLGVGRGRGHEGWNDARGVRW
jgi:hypothetical protein